MIAACTPSFLLGLRHDVRGPPQAQVQRVARVSAIACWGMEPGKGMQNKARLVAGHGKLVIQTALWCSGRFTRRRFRDTLNSR